MSSQENDIKEIEKYITFQMEGKEREEFELKISLSPSLAQQVEAFKQAMKGLEHYDLKLQLKGYHEEILNEEPGLKFNWRYATSIAASVALAIATVYLFYVQAPDHESIFIEHFTAYEDITSVRGLELDEFKKGMKLYAHGKYEDAIATLSALPKSSNFTDESRFYLGISHLALNQPKDAAEYFLLLSDSQFSEQAKWYLGLSYLREGNSSAALSALSTISHGEFKYENARIILSELN